MLEESCMKENGKDEARLDLRAQKKEVPSGREEIKIRGYNPVSLSCIVGNIISSFLREKKCPYFNRGEMLASPILYSLGVHDLDCLAYGLDEEEALSLDGEWPHHLIYVIPRGRQSEIIAKIKTRIRRLAGYKVYGYYSESHSPCLYPWRFVISRKPIKEEGRIVLKQGKKKVLAIRSGYLQAHHKELLKVDITSLWHMSFLERVMDMFPLEKEDFRGMEELEEARRKKILAVFGEKDSSLLFKEDALVDLEGYLTCLQIPDSKGISSTVKRMEAVEMLKHYALRAHYFLKHPEISYPLYFLEFLSCPLKKTILDLKRIPEERRGKIAKHIHNYHFDIKERYIGIFFLIEGRLYIYKERLIDEGTPFIDCSKGHFEFFLSLGLDDTYEYSNFPRGRVLYDNKQQCFYVYADKAILNNVEALNKIDEAFSLPVLNVKYKGDEHYRTLGY